MLGKKKVDLGGWRGLCRNLDDMSTAYQCSCMTWKECLVHVGPQMLEVAIRPLRQNGAPPTADGALCTVRDLRVGRGGSAWHDGAFLLPLS